VAFARTDAPALLASWAQRGTLGGGWAPTDDDAAAAAATAGADSAAAAAASLLPVQPQWGGFVLADWAVADPQGAWAALLELYGTPRDGSGSPGVPAPLDAGASLSNFLYFTATRPLAP
jgi:hypothetical protein